MFLFGLGVTILLFVFTFITQISNKSKTSKLPPGRRGWPLIGETLAYVSCPEKFIREHMRKYSPDVFQTSIAGEKTVIFCGPLANKFLFSNEGKLVTYWLPRSVAEAFSFPKFNSNSPSGKPADDLSYKFLKIESINRFVPVVDSMVQEHLDTYWIPYEQVKVHKLAQQLTFALGCRLLVNYSNPNPAQVKELGDAFFLLIEGILSVPINVPGTAFNKALKGGKLAQEKLVEMIRQRRSQIPHRVDNSDPCQDLVGHLLMDAEKNGTVLSEKEVASKVVGFMFAGFYPTSTTLAFLIAYLADNPQIYDKVLQEQMEITHSKPSGEPLTWKDIQKMTYSWNVICETMRLATPVAGNFRQALTDFNYAGYKIPKGWKVHWTVHTTHMNPKYFPDPKKFDPSRFEGNGPAPYTYVPFGAGPRMCAGKEYARIEMLVFLHNVVSRFSFKRVNPVEKIIYNPDPIPTEGLPIYLNPRIK